MFANTQMFIFPFFSDLQSTQIWNILCFTVREQIVEVTN